MVVSVLEAEQDVLILQCSAIFMGTCGVFFFFSEFQQIFFVDMGQDMSCHNTFDLRVSHEYSFHIK